MQRQFNSERQAAAHWMAQAASARRTFQRTKDRFWFAAAKSSVGIARAHNQAA